MRPGPTTARLILGALPALPTVLALAGTLLLFSIFPLIQGASALDAIGLIFKGAFGSSFAWQSTLLRAAPLMLTALCVALPAQVGLIVIGGEGALALGGLAAAVMPQLLPSGISWLIAAPLMAIGGMTAGGLWIAAVGAMRQWRGVNETISSLLMSYIAIALFKHLVEGPLRDPASLNKPSTLPVPDALMIGPLPGLEMHWGLLWGIVACVIAWVFVRHSTRGRWQQSGRTSRRPARQFARADRMRTGRSGCRTRRHVRSHGRTGQRQRVAARRLWLQRHSGRIRGATESACDHCVRGSDRWHRSERQPAPAAPRPA